MYSLLYVCIYVCMYVCIDECTLELLYDLVGSRFTICLVSLAERACMDETLKP